MADVFLMGEVRLKSVIDAEKCDHDCRVQDVDGDFMRGNAHIIRQAVAALIRNT